MIVYNKHDADINENEVNINCYYQNENTNKKNSVTDTLLLYRMDMYRRIVE